MGRSRDLFAQELAKMYILCISKIEISCPYISHASMSCSLFVPVRQDIGAFLSAASKSLTRRYLTPTTVLIAKRWLIRLYVAGAGRPSTLTHERGS
jgi:hypothetical protein